jgi:hypothetical protein
MTQRAIIFATLVISLCIIEKNIKAQNLQKPPSAQNNPTYSYALYYLHISPEAYLAQQESELVEAKTTGQLLRILPSVAKAALEARELEKPFLLRMKEKKYQTYLVTQCTTRILYWVTVLC